MTCASCVSRVEKKLSKIPGVQASVNLALKQAKVNVENDQIVRVQDLLDAVTKAGYTANVIEDAEISDITKEPKSVYKPRITWSLLLGLPIIAFSMIPFLQFPGWQWVIATLALPLVIYVGWPFHISALKSAKHITSTMDTLVSLGVIVSAIYSYILLFFTDAKSISYRMNMFADWGEIFGKNSLEVHAGVHPHLFFETSAMILIFLTIGKYVEENSKRKAGKALEELLSLGAKEVEILDGRVIPVTELSVGRKFRARAGSKIATDATVVSGISALDCSLVTGESTPISVRPGDEVVGGTLVLDGNLVLEAKKVGAETLLAQTAAAVSAAQAAKPKVQHLADRISAVFVPVIIVLSLLTLILNLIFQQDLSASLMRAVAVLVVACPCAIGLATPMAILVASGQAAKLGVIVRNPDVFEQAAKLNTLVLDKTGTITTGELSLDKVFLNRSPILERLGKILRISEEEAVLCMAGMVEQGSTHPVAKAITKELATLSKPIAHVEEHSATLTSDSAAIFPSAKVKTFKSVAGIGVIGIVEISEKYNFEVFVTRPLRAADIDILPDSIPKDTLSNLVDSSKNFYDHNGQNNLEVEFPEVSEVISSEDEGNEGNADDIGKHKSFTSAQILIREIPKSNLENNQVIVLGQDSQKYEDKNKDLEDEKYITTTGYVELSNTYNNLGPFTLLGRVTFTDEVRADAKQLITWLDNKNIVPKLCTGDNSRAAQQVAKAVGISPENVVSQMLPQEKGKFVSTLRSSGKVVAMVGDGVNDSPAIASANLAIAMGQGTDVAIESGDLVLLHESLQTLKLALNISSRTWRIIKENMFWAFGYNSITIPIAAVGILSPGLAAFFMASSSLIVIGNSLRLRNN